MFHLDDRNVERDALSVINPWPFNKGEFLLSIGREKKETLFRGEPISVDGEGLEFGQLLLMSRSQVRRLIRKVREEKRGNNA